MTATAGRCFASKDELQSAVDGYIGGCAEDGACEVARTYGWPMNSWCTFEVTDMSQLFYDRRTFNEDISSWDVGRVTNMNKMVCDQVNRCIQLLFE